MQPDDKHGDDVLSAPFNHRVNSLPRPGSHGDMGSRKRRSAAGKAKVAAPEAAAATPWWTYDRD